MTLKELREFVASTNSLPEDSTLRVRGSVYGLEGQRFSIELEKFLLYINDEEEGTGKRH